MRRISAASSDPGRELFQVPGRMNKREVAGRCFVGDQDVLRLQHPLAEQARYDSGYFAMGKGCRGGSGTK